MSSGRPRSLADSLAVRRVRSADVEWTRERLNERDWLILETINRLRLLRADQVERLFFAHLSGRPRVVSRGRTLHRLAAWHVLHVLPRRVGGTLGGSASSIYALGSVGRRLMAERQAAAGAAIRVRHTDLPTDRTIRHTLAVSELFTGLSEQAQLHGARLAAFEAEPGCWWPDGLGGFVKPDAYALLEAGPVRDHWWIEADLATESLPTIRRKLLTYLSFAERGQLGPGDVVPRVLVSTVTPMRCAAVAGVIRHLPAPADQLFGVTTAIDTVPHLFSVLRE